MWYSARLLFRSNVQGDPIRRPLTDERIILVQAKDARDAERIALARAGEMEAEPTDIGNLSPDEKMESATWKFLEILDLFDIGEEELRSGVEVYSLTYGHCR
jgi:hypothetical protein